MTGSIYFRGRSRGWAYQIYLGRDSAGKQRRHWGRLGHRAR